MPGHSPGSALSAERIAFRYHDRAEWVIHDFSHAFRAGVLTALTGPSGCGKSTLLYLLAGMLSPTSGAVSCEGVEVSTLPDWRRSRFRASRVGFVFQDAMLDPSRPVLDNVCEGAVFAGLSRRAARDRAAQLLARFGVAARADHRPGEISGGQAQRVALCRALLARPAIVLADEPTGNLDPDSAAIVWQALQDESDRGCCVIVATHSPALAATAGQHIEMAVP